MFVSVQVMLLLKAGHDWHKYVRSRNTFFTAGLFGGLFVSLWNALPLGLSTQQNLDRFRRDLKTLLFMWLFHNKNTYVICIH